METWLCKGFSVVVSIFCRGHFTALAMQATINSSFCSGRLNMKTNVWAWDSYDQYELKDASCAKHLCSSQPLQVEAASLPSAMQARMME